MTEKIGIKETKEALIAINESGLFIAERLKDGIGVDDGLAFYNKIVNDAEFKAIIIAAWDKKNEIPAELKNIDMQKGVELAMLQLGYLPKITAALKK